MMCPKCGGDTRVVDSRSDGRRIRKRKCCDCGKTFHTIEVIISDEAGVAILRGIYHVVRKGASR